MHRSGVTHGRSFAWSDRLAQARAALAGLAVPLPVLAEAAAPMLARLESIAAAHPPDSSVPSHGAFRAAQVMVDEDRVGFIDFDGSCQSEPAMDLARFIATTKDVGLHAAFDEDGEPPTDARRVEVLLRLEAQCETFLSAYEALATVSRTRIALWETLNLFTLVMACWKKIKPDEIGNTVLMLDRCLERGVLER